jgi:hypothetical protein
MIAAVATTTNAMSLDHVPFGWFDAVLLVVIGFGFFRGRKNGMTKEVLPMFQWLATVLVCGLGYEMAGGFFMNLMRLNRLQACICGYLFLAFLVFLLFIWLKKILMPRLTGSNFFGSAEYYLGTVSGVIRFLCMLFFALALLNAPIYSAAEIAAHKAYEARWYGGGQQGYNGNFFPTVQSVQEAVFEKSFTGPYIREYLGVMLINTASGNGGNVRAEKPAIRMGN